MTIRVLIVDDSALVREVLTQMLSKAEDKIGRAHV